MHRSTANSATPLALVILSGAHSCTLREEDVHIQHGVEGIENLRGCQPGLRNSAASERDQRHAKIPRRRESQRRATREPRLEVEKGSEKKDPARMIPSMKEPWQLIQSANRSGRQKNQRGLRVRPRWISASSAIKQEVGDQLRANGKTDGAEEPDGHARRQRPLWRFPSKGSKGSNRRPAERSRKSTARASGRRRPPHL